MHYLAFGYPNDEGGYGFTIPDIPGFTADGGEATLDVSLAVARRVLADHLAARVDAGLEIPVARRPDEVLEDPAFAEERELASFFTLLPAVMPAGRTMRINVTMDESTLGLVDRAAGDRNLTRSAFIAEACRRFAVEGPGGMAGVVDLYRQQNLAPNFTARIEESMRRIDEWLESAVMSRPQLFQEDGSPYAAPSEAGGLASVRKLLDESNARIEKIIGEAIGTVSGNSGVRATRAKSRSEGQAENPNRLTFATRKRALKLDDD